MPTPFFLRRRRSIRSRIGILLLAPLVPLLGMWAFSTSISLASALNLLNAKTNAEEAVLPASEVVYQLQLERKLSTRFVSGDGRVEQELKSQREQTDVAIADLRRLAGGDSLRHAASAVTAQHLAAVLKALEGLPTGRAVIDTRQSGRPQVMALYGGIIDRAFAVYDSIVGIVDDHEIARQGLTTLALSEAREMYTREDALVSGVLAGGGTFAPGERSLLIKIIGTQRYLYQTATRELQPADRTVYDEIVRGAPYRRLQATEDKITDATKGAVAGVDATRWNADVTALNTQLGDLEVVAANRAIASAGTVAVAIMLRLGVAGGLGLLVIVALVVIAIRAARSIIRRIAALRQQALHVAEDKLPAVVARLRAGEEVDVDVEAPPLSEVDDELDQLASAFAQVQRTAVGSAVQEAVLRAGLNQVFLNLGRRSQVLVHRQLALLDAMERRVTDPHDLEELYRIDHLGTRMRRHAEDLVILAGAVPGRGWRNPVPLHDVLRSAASEVEEYTRVTLIPLAELALLGRAVSDVVHLLAELLENATVFSPRDTQVKLSGQLVPNGFAVEIEDRGVGMPPEAVDEANRRLADPPDFDPAHSSRLGLFVVARLAARHGIRVTLRPSPYGGITAVALLPREIVAAEYPPAQGELATDSAPRHSANRPLAVAAAPATLDASRTGTLATLDVPTARPGAANAPLSPEGLPIRQRQASLAPQLRTDPAATVAQPVARLPEATRSMLSSLQAGTHRGRAAAQAEHPVQSGDTRPAGGPSLEAAGTETSEEPPS
jgi:signal transduction histidine kinase